MVAHQTCLCYDLTMPDQTPEHIQGAGPNDQKVELHPEVAATGVKPVNEQDDIKKIHEVISEVHGSVTGPETPVAHVDGALDHKQFEESKGADDTGKYDAIRLKLQNEIVNNTGLKEE